MAAILDHGKWGFLDQQGNVVIPETFLEVEPFVKNKAWLKTTDGWALIDRTGKSLSQGVYSSFERLSGSYTDKVETEELLLSSFWQVEQNGQWGLINILASCASHVSLMQSVLSSKLRKICWRGCIWMRMN